WHSRGGADARALARPRRRARGRADRRHHCTERRADAAAAARARSRARGRRLRAAARLSRPLVLPAALRGARDRDELPRAADPPDAVRAGVGARRADGPIAAAARGTGGARRAPMSVARLRLAPVGETMSPPRAPFFKA